MKKAEQYFDAEKIAADLRKFQELKTSGLSSTMAAKSLGMPLGWVTGEECYLARFERAGMAGLAPAERAEAAPVVGGNELPAWFLPAAKYFYILSSNRREGGSVPKAVLRTIELPNLPAGWNGQHSARMGKWLAKWSGGVDLPVCPPGLKENILARQRSGKALVPQSVAKRIAVPKAVMQRFWSPRASALDTLSAPGSQRRYFNAATGRREIKRGGDWFGGDDSTPGIAVCVPSAEINTPCSQRYGVLLGRFQWLAYNDNRTGKILASDYVVRPRGSYRAEDIVNGMGAVTRAHGIPRKGWQFEGATWDAKLVRQAIEMMRCEHWRTYNPHQKAIEAIFNLMWTELAMQFPHADMGRYRNEKEENCLLYESCKAGHKDPRKYFPTVDFLLKVLDEAIARHNGHRVNSRQYGTWIPDELFDLHRVDPPLRPFSPEMAWIFSPFSVERKIQGMGVSCSVPMFEDFSVPFDFSAPWMPLHRGKKVRIHFNPREPACVAKVVLLEASGMEKAGAVLGDAELIGETARHVREVMNWAQDDHQAGYLARQKTAHFLARYTRAMGPAGRRVEYTEVRDGVGRVTKLERIGAQSPKSSIQSPVASKPVRSREERVRMAQELEQFERAHQYMRG